jgi:hypothetical protein
MSRPVDHHGAGAAFGPVAAQLGAREAQLVAQGHGQCFLWEYIDAAQLAIDVQRDQALDRTGCGAPIRCATGQTCGQESGRRRHGSGRDDPLDELATRVLACARQQLSTPY